MFWRGQKLRPKREKTPPKRGLRSGGIQEDYRKLESHYGWQRQGWASQEDSPLLRHSCNPTGSRSGCAYLRFVPRGSSGRPSTPQGKVAD